ncbi:substrate-binding domain-containing protein [Clostridium sp. C105KSO13]|uniref:substrate-binding domain-containing protein n=1 Tax=Clostridium sp. C105KSO13 TaxID=1776045 RepID=UPI0007406774|nr:substrate-binding domain-containing protein [Clostridium sp. C105KSO13]CUX36037.1 D-allose-binding periplasmic protein precursor [Clostridium sp. C105KSO13]
MMKKNRYKEIRAGVLISGVLAVIFLTMFFLWNSQNHEQRAYKVILIPKVIDNTNGFWTSLTEGAQLGAAELNIDLEVVGGSSEEDVEGQIQYIKESIQKKPDAIIVAPCSYSETSNALQDVVDNDIRLVLIDSVIDRDIAESTVSTDNYVAGKELGEFTKTLLAKDMQIGIVAHVKGASTAIERENGMRAGLGKYEHQVVDIVFSGSSYDKAYSLTKDMMEKHPKIKVIMGTNEYSAVGAARAIEDLGLTGKVKVVGFDNSIEEIQMLEAGVFQGIIIQKPFNMGYLSIQQAAKILGGQPIEKKLDSGSKMITKKNMYEEENQRLLYPFTGQQ